MVVSELSKLANNLQNIELVVRGEGANPCDLMVTDGFGNVYSSNSLYGMFFKEIKFFQNCLGYKEKVQYPLYELLMKIGDTFENFSKQACEHNENYRSYFSLRAKGIKIEKKEYDEIEESRHFLAAWISGTSSLLHLIKNNETVALKIGRIFNRIDIFKSEKVRCVDLSAPLIQLEHLLNGDIPVKVLAALSSESKLSDEEELAIQEWISKVNDLQDKIGIRSFDQALRELVKCIGEGSKLGLLEKNLRDRGCKLFEQVDRKLIMKYHYPESISRIFGKKLTELEGSKKGRFKVFEIENDESKVVIVGSSRPDLLLKYGEVSWGIDGIKVYEWDPNGNFIVAEKLKNSLSSYKWDSNGYKLTDRDAEIAMVLANVIYNLHQSHPSGIDPDDLMFNERGELRTVKLYEKSHGFDFIAWEDFCLKAAKDNNWVFHYLMKVSKLSECSEAKYFSSVIKNDFNKECKVEIPKDITLKTIKKSIELSSKAKSVLDQCCGRLIEWNPEFKKNITVLEATIYDRMIYYYERSGAAANLLPSVADYVVEDIKSGKPLSSVLNSEYYSQQHKKMNELEERAKELSKEKLLSRDDL